MKAKRSPKQVSIEEYVETYCREKRIRERFAVYVSPKTHGNLKSIARLFAGEQHTTASSLADSIISCHFEAYRELLNGVRKEDRHGFLEWMEGMKRCGNEEQDDVEV
jgi:hypothetical protein